MQPSRGDTPAGPDLLRQVRSVYQPVVDLDSRDVVGYEALARGPRGSRLESPVAMFAAARSAGLVRELDWACRLAAFRGALEQGVPGRLGLFVNVEPTALDAPPPAGASAVLDRVDLELPVVMEITERALTADPAGLLRSAEQTRARGWLLAVDDVGADCASLALLPFLAPDIIKLDLRLVQAHTTIDIAEIIAAVNAQAERTGALVLAEGIETENQAELAEMMGATLGQGWLFGRPGPLPAHIPAVAVGAPPRRPRATTAGTTASTPYELVEGRPEIRRSTKPLLVAVSRQLERQAHALGEPAVMLATFQTAEHFTSTTARRYAALAGSCAFTGAFAVGLDAEPARGVRGTDLSPQGRLAAEWDVVVVGPHLAAALLTRDLGDGGPDAERRFDYLVTYDRETVLAAARMLLELVPALSPDQPDRVAVGPRATAGPDDPSLGGLLGELSALKNSPRSRGARPALDGELDAVLTAAGVSAPYGISIADARRPELPLIWVNAAFTDLTGYPAEEVLARNCRFLQGPRTDLEAVRRMRGQLQAGRVARATLLNYRRDGSTFWNDLQIVPVRDGRDVVTHYVGQQHDVTEQVDARQRADYLGSHDPLTGLANRTSLQAHLAAETSRADRSGTTVALLYLDLDHFKAVNDQLGHAAGDQLLVRVADRLRAAGQEGELLARLGGDEFLLVLTGLREQPGSEALRRAQAVLTAISAPITLPGRPGEPLSVGASIGVSMYPADATTAADLLDHADRAMYECKAAGRHRAVLWQRPPVIAST